jgi:hypothetical protein
MHMIDFLSYVSLKTHTYCKLALLPQSGETTVYNRGSQTTGRMQPSDVFCAAYVSCI